MKDQDFWFFCLNHENEEIVFSTNENIAFRKTLEKSDFNDILLDNEIWLQKLSMGNINLLMVKCNVHKLIQEKTFMIILLSFLVF